MSRVGPGRTQLALMFPRPPSIIPYGGFAPVRLETPPSTGNPSALRRLIPVQHPHHRPTFCPGVLIPSRGHRLTVVGRRAAGGAHRPLAQPGLSSPGLQSLLRPESPVSGTPAGFVVRLIPPGLCPRGRSQSPSLLCLGTLSTPATTLTPPGTLISSDGCSISAGSLRPSGWDSATGFSHLFLVSDGFGNGAAVFSCRLRPMWWLGRLTSPRRRVAAPTGPPVYSRACPSRGLPQPESAMTTRLNHRLPRRDLHPQVCQRSKAARLNSEVQIAEPRSSSDGHFSLRRAAGLFGFQDDAPPRHWPA
jgi:hypothetical protein